MSNWIINYTKSAYSELDAIYKYIAQDLNVPNTANKQIKRITSAIDSLEEMPLRNPLYDEEPWKSRGLRKMLVDNYIIFYPLSYLKYRVWLLKEIYPISNRIKGLWNEGDEK